MTLFSLPGDSRIQGLPEHGEIGYHLGLSLPCRNSSIYDQVVSRNNPGKRRHYRAV